MFSFVLLYLVAIGNGNGQIQVYSSSSSQFLINSFQAHSNTIYRIKQLPNGYVATCSWDYTAKIWNVTTINKNNTWNLIRTYTHTSTVQAIEYISTDTMASGSSDQSIQIWSISTGETLMTINTGDVVNCLKLLSNGFYLAAGLGSGQINIYNINNGGSLVSTFTGPILNGQVNDLVLINTNLLANSGGDNTVHIWDLTTNTIKCILTGHTGYVYGLKLVSSDILAGGSSDYKIYMWDITSGTLIKTLFGHTYEIKHSIDLISNEILVSGSGDNTIKTWNILTGQVLNTIDTGLYIYSLAVLNPINYSKMTFKIEIIFNVLILTVQIIFKEI